MTVALELDIDQTVSLSSHNYMCASRHGSRIEIRKYSTMSSISEVRRRSRLHEDLQHWASDVLINLCGLRKTMVDVNSYRRSRSSE